METLDEDGFSVEDYGPYNSPENYGLEIVGSIDWTDEAYQFSKTVVWRDITTGEYLFTSDSGCSCPCPFEDYTRADLIPIPSLADLQERLEARNASHGPYYPDRSGEIVVLVERLHALGLR